MRISLSIAALLALAAPAAAQLPLVQTPLPGGGVTRASQLWQDPSGNDNNLDGDAVVWDDFVLPAPAAIGHLEWWGTGASELGFQVEIWRQDPGTIAYQPLSVFYYGYHGDGDPPVQPTARFTFTPDVLTIDAAPGGLTHFAADLATPLVLAASTAANPRWFIGVIGLTAQPYAWWNWAQGTGGTPSTFQWIRGYHNPGDGFLRLGENRALVVAGPTAVVPEPHASALLGGGVLALAFVARRSRRSRHGRS